MARIRKVFQSSEISSSEHEIEVQVNDNNEVYIQIYTGDDLLNESSWINLDESTAIKFSKELRIAISEIKNFNG